MDDSERRRIVESVILGSPEPISAQRVAAVIPYCKPAKVKALIEDLNAEYAEQGRSFEIGEIAGGYQVRTLPEFASYLQQIQPQRPLRLSKAALETLAIVAYRQPVTRAEIEDVRGVDAGAVVRGLMERKLLRIAGQKEVPGRPMLFGTTRRFLEVFGLERLEDLPSLRQLEGLAPRDAVDAGAAEGEGSDSPAEEGEPEAGFEASMESQTAFFEEVKPIGKPH
jgi:segregation and condensation protein B